MTRHSSPRHAMALVWLLLALALAACQAQPRLVGTSLEGVPAPDFRLLDQGGQPVALSDLRGKVVALTFLYTSCPDTCPLIANKLGQAHDRLGERAQDVAFEAVSVDPERDDIARVRQYVEAQGLHARGRVARLLHRRHQRAPCRCR